MTKSQTGLQLTDTHSNRLDPPLISKFAKWSQFADDQRIVKTLSVNHRECSKHPLVKRPVLAQSGRPATDTSLLAHQAYAPHRPQFPSHFAGSASFQMLSV